MLHKLPEDIIFYKILPFINCYNEMINVNKNANNLLIRRQKKLKCYTKPKVYYEFNYWCSTCNPLEFKITTTLKKNNAPHFVRISKNELKVYCKNIFKDSSLNYKICCNAIPGIVIENNFMHEFDYKYY